MAKKFDRHQSLPFIINEANGSKNEGKDTGLQSFAIDEDDFSADYAIGLDILTESPERIATQITLLDVPIFKAIQPEELMSCAWNNKDKKLRTPNIVAMTQRFNCTCFWVQNEILCKGKVKTRGERICWFIKLAKKLLEINNIHALKAVICGLRSAPIYRLYKSWAIIPKKDKSALEKMNELLSESENNAKLREHLTNIKNPVIPYLGLFLTDLMYINAAYKPVNEMIEVDKRSVKMNNVIRIIASYQASNYDYIGIVPHLQEYLKSFKYIEELQSFVEEEYYRKSMEIEPQNNTSDDQRGQLESSLTDTSGIVRNHRKSGSVGSTPQCHRHPLDDSVITLFKQRSISSYSINSSIVSDDSDSVASMQIQDSIAIRLLSSEQFSIQGCLKKKTCIKRGSKRVLSHWKTYWAALSCSDLYLFSGKHTRSGKERSDFKRNPCKKYDMTGWAVLLDDCRYPQFIYLSNVERGDKYKLDANNSQNASVWYKSLLDATSKTQVTVEESGNLMTFE